MKKAEENRDAETRRHGDAAMDGLPRHGNSAGRAIHVSASRRPRVPASFLILVLCLLAGLSCSPSRVSAVSANATEGYCPVCKMNVKADGEWTAEIYYNDGTKLMFESPGDMLAFYFAPEKYAASDKQKDRASIEKVMVKDYQSKKQIEARQAALVYDSSVKSDMGPELVPFSTRAAAEAVVAKNGGKVITWSEVTPEMVRDLRK